MATLLKDMPEKATAIQPVIAKFQGAFKVCDPVIQYAANSTTAEDNLKAAARLKAECVPALDGANHEQVKLIETLLASAAKKVDDLTVEANASILTVWVATGAGLVLGLIVAMWIGIKNISQSVGRLKVMMEKLAKGDLSLASSV
jgi:methyl-accepting chemotaxis protein